MRAANPGLDDGIPFGRCECKRARLKLTCHAAGETRMSNASERQTVMNSIVLELQHSAMDKRTDVDDLLRRCVVIATKLAQKEFLAWSRNELDGYGENKVPDYRIVSGRVMAFNPYNGAWIPFTWQEEPPESLRRRAVGQRIAELQELIKGDDRGVLAMPFSAEVGYRLMQMGDSVRPPDFIVPKISLHGIIDAVRNVILDWSLKLEADGILGEGMTFTKEEKKTAMNNTYNIGNIGSISGGLGNLSSQKVHIGNYTSIHSELKALGIPKPERDELEELMDNVPEAKGSEKKKLVAKGIEWVVRNADKLGKLSDSIRGWFETAT